MRNDNLRRVGLVLISAALTAACAHEAAPSGGYTGTWSRGNDVVSSTIAIAERDGTYLFRWGKESADGRVKVSCEWNGECVELSDGQEVGRYRFRAWIDEPSGHLRIECTGRLHQAPDPEVHYVDEAILRRDGTRLMIRTIERSGKTFTAREQPRFKFTKVSDTVEDLPPAGD